MTEAVTALTTLPDLSVLDARVVMSAAQRAQEWLLSDGLRVLATIAIALVARWALHRVVGRTVARMTERSTQRAGETDAEGNLLKTTTGLSGERHRARVQTVGSLLRSVGTFVIGIVAGLTVMGLIGLPLGPLLASAGVGGVAIGFGAQSLVKDFLSGIFMIFEDQYGVGDVVDTGEAIGTIEEVTLRITRLRDVDGVVWYVRNGEIVRIGNRSQGYGAAWVELPVSYREDISRVLGVVRGVCETFAADPEWEPKLIEPPTVLGVDSITGQTVTIKVLAKCLAGEQFAVQRELRARAKEAFDAEGIQGPPLPPFAPGTQP
nr:mechanosensitive ion channel family protein [Phycicoccus flavus]